MHLGAIFNEFQLCFGDFYFDTFRSPLQLVVYKV